MSEEFDTQVRDDGTACTKYELFSGKGTRIEPNGIKYIGEWKDGGYDGNGTITYPNGTKYIGEFKGRDFNGNGTITYSDGHKYSGEFVNGTFNGNGTFTLPNKSVIEGKFKDGKANGYGVYTAPKQIYEGYFENGKKNGEGTLKMLDGDKVYGIYNGTFKDSFFHGKGKLHRPKRKMRQNAVMSCIFYNYVSSSLINEFL